MKFQKGRAKTGGRKPGVGNKIGAPLREALADKTGEYFTSGKFEKDLAAIVEPKDRIDLMLKAARFVLPYKSDVRADITSSVERTIEDELIALSRGEGD